MPLRTLVALLILGSCTLARAQDVEKQVARMNQKAMEDYDSLEFESARKTLIDAVAMLRSNGLDESPIAAKTFVHLGIIYISGFKDRTRGQQQFVNALKIKPDYKLDPTIATPELEEAFQAAQKQAGVSARKAPPATPPPTAEVPARPPAEEVHGLEHAPIDEARPNTAVPIHARLGAELGATKVLLFYRASGQEDFIVSPMKNAGGGEWAGVIAPEATTGRVVQYYLEARDARGRAVVSSGSALSPYIITISAGAPAFGVAEVEVEDPLAAERARKAREEEERRKGKPHRFFVFASLGTGFGYEPAGNHTEVAWQYQPPPTDQFVQQNVGSGGVAFSPLFVGVEAGVRVAAGFALSVVGRFQVYTGANAETQSPLATGMQPVSTTSKATGAAAGWLRARYNFLDGRVHPYVHADIGGGEIRHVLDISQPMGVPPLVDQYTANQYNGGNQATPKSGMIAAPGNQTVCANAQSCSDTIALGYFLAGGGVGLWIDVQKYLALILDVTVLGAVGLGSDQGGMNIDFSLGFGAHF
jgi:hypothetical protein